MGTHTQDRQEYGLSVEALHLGDLYLVPCVVFLQCSSSVQPTWAWRALTCGTGEGLGRGSRSSLAHEGWNVGDEPGAVHIPRQSHPASNACARCPLYRSRVFTVSTGVRSGTRNICATPGEGQGVIAAMHLHRTSCSDLVEAKHRLRKRKASGRDVAPADFVTERVRLGGRRCRSRSMSCGAAALRD